MTVEIYKDMSVCVCLLVLNGHILIINFNNSVAFILLWQLTTLALWIGLLFYTSDESALLMNAPVHNFPMFLYNFYV